MRAIGVLAAFDHGEVKPAFSGGTSLSKGWGLIKRFSEDIDFKVSSSRQHPAARRSGTSAAATASGFSNALQAAEFELSGERSEGR